MATTEERVHELAPQLRPDQIALTIDDQEVVCDKGDSILEAAQKAGIHIPTLCYEPRLPANAACRVCMVEVEGARKLVPSCATAAADGMVVRTNTEKVRAAAPPLPGAAALRPQLVLHAALPRRLPDAHQDPAVPRLHRPRRLQERRAQAARGPALPGHPRARLPAALRGPVPAPARRAPHHHLLAAPLHGRPVPRRGADGRAPAAGRAQARQRQARRRRRRRARPASPAPSTPVSRGTPSRSSRRCPSRAACCATASPATACRATCIEKELNVLWRMGVELQVQQPPGRATSSSRTCSSRATTPSSSASAPSTRTRWASRTRTPTAS